MAKVYKRLFKESLDDILIEAAEVVVDLAGGDSSAIDRNFENLLSDGIQFYPRLKSNRNFILQSKDQVLSYALEFAGGF